MASLALAIQLPFEREPLSLLAYKCVTALLPPFLRARAVSVFMHIDMAGVLHSPVVV